MKLLHIKTAKEFDGSDLTRLFIFITHRYISLAMSNKLYSDEFKRTFYCKKEKLLIKVTDLTNSYIRFTLYEGGEKMKIIMLDYELTVVPTKIVFLRFREAIDYTVTKT